MKTIAAVLLLISSAFAQSQPASKKGILYAPDYAFGNGQVAPLVISAGNSATGSQTITLLNPVVTLQDGRRVMPLATNVPLLVDTGSNQETVTPSAISGCSLGSQPSSCQITATFTHAHPAGTIIASGDSGSQEALNDATALGNIAFVIDSTGKSIGGSSGFVTPSGSYTWTGAQTFNPTSGVNAFMKASLYPVNPDCSAVITTGINTTHEAAGVLESCETGAGPFLNFFNQNYTNSSWQIGRSGATYAGNGSTKFEINIIHDDGSSPQTMLNIADNGQVSAPAFIPTLFVQSPSYQGQETTAPAGAANFDFLWPDSTVHRWRMNNNNGTSMNATTSLSASGTLTYTAIAANSCQEQTMTITGAATTQVAWASPQASLGNANLVWSAWVSAAGTVSVRLCNVTTGSITPSAVAWAVGAGTP